MIERLNSPRFTRAVDILVALVPFYLISVMWEPVSGSVLVAPLLNFLIGAVVGITIPILLFGRPTAHVGWKVDNIDAVAATQTLDFNSRTEIACRLIVTVHCNSLTAWFILRNLVKKQTTLVVEFRPNGVVRLKDQLSDGGATVDSSRSRVQLPVTVARNGAKQECRAEYGFVAPRAEQVGETVQVSVESTKAEALSKSRYPLLGDGLKITSDVYDLYVRK